MDRSPNSEQSTDDRKRRLEDDVPSEEYIEDDAQQVGILYNVECAQDVGILHDRRVPIFLMFEAPSRIFRWVDWVAVNMSLLHYRQSVVCEKEVKSYVKGSILWIR